MELIGGGYNLYKVIYSFHMPMFLFLNGWLAPQNYVSKKTIFKLAYPYIFFQIAYQLFVTYVVNEGSEKFSVQFGTPFWLLWYLLTLLFYYLLNPVIATESAKCAGIFLGGAILLAMAAGFDNSIGYYMSLSRSFAFLPYFMFGYYMGHGVLRDNDGIWGIRKSKFKIMMNFVLAIILCVVVYKHSGALYGSVSYQAGGFLWYIRLEMLIAAFVWIKIFMMLTPNRKIFGRPDTFSIYIMHGFIILYLRKHNPFLYSLPVNFLIASLICIIAIMVFGNKYVSRMIRFLFRGEWVIKIWDMVVTKRNV